MMNILKRRVLSSFALVRADYVIWCSGFYLTIAVIVMSK